MKALKKIVVFLFLASVFVFFGCESTNDIRCAYFSDITLPGSDSNTIRVNFEKDSRVDEKYVDIQVRSSKDCDVEINAENEEPVLIYFDDTKWKSLTTLLVEGKGQSGTETFKRYKQAQSMTYILKSTESVELLFRVVVGDSNENSDKTGYILTNGKEVSNEFKLKLVPKKT